ncbi:MAG: hypothetical protein MRZ79_12610 [Bacteroidia bacterium]|nr:hypothetical protein [Bacteroidia bacterium]
MADKPALTQQEKDILKRYKRRLYTLMAISSGIDVALSTAEIALAIPSFGSSIVVEEIIEWIISSLLAKNKMELKKRYKITGLLPIPGLTSLTLQALLELRKVGQDPDEILKKFENELSETKAVE